MACTNELNNRFIAIAIADLRYTGYVAHEHRPGPGRDPIQSLEEYFDILKRLVHGSVGTSETAGRKEQDSGT